MDNTRIQSAFNVSLCVSTRTCKNGVNSATLSECFTCLGVIAAGELEGSYFIIDHMKLTRAVKDLETKMDEKISFALNKEQLKVSRWRVISTNF